MTKRYSQKWQRYFIRLLEGEPFFYEVEDNPVRRRKAKMQIAAVMAIVGGAYPYII